MSGSALREWIWQRGEIKRGDMQRRQSSERGFESREQKQGEQEGRERRGGVQGRKIQYVSDQKKGILDQRGQTLTEYLSLVILISLVAVGTVGKLGKTIKRQIKSAEERIGSITYHSSREDRPSSPHSSDEPPPPRQSSPRQSSSSGLDSGS